MADLTKRTVKHVYFRYRAEVADPRNPGETRIAVRTATRGQEVELMPEDLAVGEEHDAFFSAEQVKAMAGGLSPEAVIIKEVTGNLPEYVEALGPDIQSDAPADVMPDADGVDDDADDLDGEDDDVDLDELDDDELAETVEDMTIPALVEAVGDDAELAQRVLAADAQATGGDPRKGLQHELDKVIAASGDED